MTKISRTFCIDDNIYFALKKWCEKKELNINDFIGQAVQSELKAARKVDRQSKEAKK